MEGVGNEFRETFGFDPSTARVKFGWAYGSPAFTYENTITIDASKGWAGWDSVAQGDLLVHELTHSVQFSQGGAATVMARTIGEGAQIWRDVYARPTDLLRITDLKTLNVLDSRFTIESIATHVEKTMAPSSNSAYRVR